ncbi:MAG: hypothetical protein G01um101420_715 [Parcubacteria group bacterium Gr01-1014_20]|nr:MAG: hypothetical protein G01um101420_715 [Parcubacteria group bacterium Gr01-1014_20]
MSNIADRFVAWLFPKVAKIGTPGDSKTENGTDSNNLVAILVDFDNVVLCASEASYKVSFTKLRDYCRSFGTVAFAEVFLSAQLFDEEAHPEFEGKVRLINSLNNAGFKVVICPRGLKDRDQVDSYLKSSGLSLARNSLVKKIIVVSDDSDFKDPNFIHPIEDMDKEVIILRPSDLGDKINDKDGGGETLLFDSRKREFSRILELVARGETSLHEETRQAIAFIKVVVRKVFELTTPERNQYPFRHIINLAWKGIIDQWGEIYTKEDLEAAMGAIADKGLIEKKAVVIGGVTVFKYYRPNRAHPAAINLMPVKRVTSES